MDVLLEWLPIVMALAATGVVAGILAGLLGVGGGIVIVPVLYFIFQLLGISPATAMSVATGTSLLTIIPTSLSSIRSHRQRGNVQFALLRWWGPWIVLGVIIGVFAATRAGGDFASGVFGIIAILVALNMLSAKNRVLAKQLPHRAWQALMASVIGAISAIMGIGGGTLGVTALCAFNTPTHKAVGTSAAFGLVIAVPGALLMLLLGQTPADAPVGTVGLVNLIGFACIVPLTVATAPLGVLLGAKLNSARLKKVFAVFLCISGARMFYQLIS